METTRTPRIVVLYHYFHPDDVVSARHFTQLCLGLRERGWNVEVLPSNRSCRDSEASYPLKESWQGLLINRVWRPRLLQSSSLGRVLNALWMLGVWSRLGLRSRRSAPDVILVGTDPLLAVLVAWVVRKLRPRIRVAHWCFDLYPEAAIAEGMVSGDSFLVRGLRYLLRAAYASCDLIADLGECMRRRLQSYRHGAREVTLVPWALVEPESVEPPDSSLRRQMFGEASLGLLYSGNFGRAHSYAEFLELACQLQGSNVHFCFGVRGNRVEELRKAVLPEDSNIHFAGFAPESELARRLAAADVHLVSLQPEWSGLVVPSKFFGALAVGRPVLFAGPQDAAIARWIEEHGVGWVLTPGSVGEVAAQLRELAASPQRLEALQRRCQQVYRHHFSRCQIVDAWHRELLALLPSPSALVNSRPAISFPDRLASSEILASS